MRPRSDQRPTIGFLSTWSVYEGTTIDNYTHTLLRGICAAASELGCSLLIGCGISLPGSPRGSRTAWPVAGARADFVPVGPWNCDGLIIIPDDLTPEQYDYTQDLIRAGYPLLLTTTEKAGPTLAVDNAGGVRQALEHLLGHGHTQIAFIAGKAGRGGDSGERLAAFRLAVRENGLPLDERLIAFGEHRREDGHAAMRQILATGAPFSAVIASNDLSALGAADALRESGRRIPEDAALIGFDDILEARSQNPPLTTVRLPAYALGYQAVQNILGQLDGSQAAGPGGARVATRLVVRQSCGCRPEAARAPAHALPLPSDPQEAGAALAAWMAEMVLGEARQSLRDAIGARSAELAAAFIESLRRAEIRPFDDCLLALYGWLGERAEDTYAWQMVFTALRASLPDPLPAAPQAPAGFVTALIDHARLGLAELDRRQMAEALVRQMTGANRLGLMTSQLLAAQDAAGAGRILSEHLPQLGIRQALVGLYTQSEEDPQLESEPILGVGLNPQMAGPRFLTRQFPPAALFPGGAPYQLALLPLEVDEHTSGFAAFDTGNLEACAAVTHNLASALRASRLIRDALQGRSMAEEASRLKSRFLSIVSHELQTPLSMIVGLSEMIVQGLPPPNAPAAPAAETTGTGVPVGTEVPVGTGVPGGTGVPAATRRDLEQIHASAQHLARLIGDVLDLASSEAGQLRILREPLDLAEVLRVAARIGEQLAREKGLAWESRIPERGPWVLGDRTRLRQVALNLISNAVKFTAEGRVTLILTASDGQAALAVSDTGIGIQPGEFESIFVEFQRAERSARQGYGGMGLGLAISRQLAEQHGGSLTVRSPGDLGRGSTFTFSIPVLEEGSLQKSLAPGAAAVPGAARTVLLVDDDPTLLDMNRRLLEQAGCRVLLAAGGREALQIVDVNLPDLILLDLMMPEMDGFAVLEALREREAARGVPVIILTARALSEADLERCGRGVAAVLTKGLFSGSELLEHVEAALKGENTLSLPTQKIVRQAAAWIHAHYAEPITREEIAANVGISPDYLTDCFRLEMGLTPITYLRRWRIRQARELLLDSDLTITQVAMATGFSESAHFTRAFHREAGLTPRAFRQAGRARRP